MNEDSFIAEKAPVDWYAMRERLRKNDAGVWREAFSDYFETHLNLRYLDPIKVLQGTGTLQGEGLEVAPFV